MNPHVDPLQESLLDAKPTFVLQSSSELTCPYYSFGPFGLLVFCSIAKPNSEFQSSQKEIV